ncbi:MAG TPA: FecR domain-containing protein [Rhodothermales bacterium]|nr:FecR domain-containing protein [Rhodothermales bacterium]
MNDNHQDLPPALREALEGQPDAARKQVEQTWHLLGKAEPSALDVPDDDAAWAALQPQLDSEQPPRPKHLALDRIARRPRRRWWLGVVTGMVIVMLVGWAWWQQQVTVIASPGEQITMIFPDGSTAVLNSGTRMRYDRRFESLPFFAARQRRVKLEGEAFFEVVSADRPFVIETFNAQVEVLGTAFNVRTRRATLDQETRVTMVEGQVRVRARVNPDHTIMLTEAGQEARIAPGAVGQQQQPSPVEALDHVLAWRTQGFVVVDRPIAMILAEVERRYALEIEPDESLVLTDSMSLFYLRGATPEKILHDLCLNQGCTYRRTSRGFALASSLP